MGCDGLVPLALELPDFVFQLAFAMDDLFGEVNVRLFDDED